MHKPDNLSSLMVALSHVFTLRRVLNDLSTEHVDAGRANAVLSAALTAGKSVGVAC